MQCGVNEYTPIGSSQALHEIVDDLALDNEVFAENFMEGWQVMTTNGYSLENLQVGPQNGWMGHYSLSQQGVLFDDTFEKGTETRKGYYFHCQLCCNDDPKPKKIYMKEDFYFTCKN